MILLGQYDSPFVRRVGIALRRYQLPFEHRPWSVWGNAEQIAEYNPLRRVPTLIWEDGSALGESSAILQALDDFVAPERSLWPAPGLAKREGLRIAALSTGICDKAVILLYSSLSLMAPSAQWQARCEQQIREAFARLERDRAAASTQFWLGDSLTHADIAFACAFRFMTDAHPALLDASRLPKLSALFQRCEAEPEFGEIYLPITNNLKND